MPACASPAIESPATTATAIGRNSGSTIASAASGNSAPLRRTADRNGGPSPGRGARSVTTSSTATSDRQRVEDADGRPGPRPAEHLAQLDGDHRIASTRSVLVPAAASTTSSRVGRSSASPVTGDAGGDQPRVDLGRVAAADDHPVAVDRR